MKQILKVIAISLSCVVGALGLAIGGMYLFGGFNEEIIYANDLYFSETQQVSSGVMYMQVNTNTSDVTKKTLKLVASAGGERIIDFPEEITLGQVFIVEPKRDINGVNIGGNVTLTAYYDDTGANPSVKAICNVLIDIPVQKVELMKIKNTVLTPNNSVSICVKNAYVDSTLDITPAFSLTPYKKSGGVRVNNIVDKALFVELCGDNGSAVNPEVAYLADGSRNSYNSNIVELKYKYDNNGDLVFDNTVQLICGQEQTDIYLKVYSYSTYKDQSKNLLTDNTVVLDPDMAIGTEKACTIGNFTIDTMTIFNNTHETITKEVYFNEEVKLFINNSDVSGSNDINLDVKLAASQSQGINISRLYYTNYVYAKISGVGGASTALVRLSKNNGEDGERGTPIDSGEYGNVAYDGVSDQMSELCWTFKISDFVAYYDYVKSGNEKFYEVQLVYYLREAQTGDIDFDINDNVNLSGDQLALSCSFYIVPKIYEVTSISAKYPAGATAVSVKTSEDFDLNNNLVSINSTLPPEKISQYSLMYYLSYNQNFKNGVTTISTTPTQIGAYRVEFDFIISENGVLVLNPTEYNATVFKFDRVQFEQHASSVNHETVMTYDASGQMSYEKGQDDIFEKDIIIHATVTMSVNGEMSIPSLFTVTSFYDSAEVDNVIISANTTKFYESKSDNTYEPFPYLVVDGVKYTIDIY